MTCLCMVSFGFVAFEGFRVRLSLGRSVRDDASDPSRKRGHTEATDGPDDPRFGDITNEGK